MLTRSTEEIGVVPEFLTGVDPTMVAEFHRRLEEIARQSSSAPAGVELSKQLDLSGYQGIGGAACILTSVTEIDDEKGPVD